MDMIDKVNIGIEIAGVKLNSPLILSEGPLSGTAKLIKRAAEHKLGAIVTKSIRSEPAASPSRYMIRVKKGLINADWTDMGFDRWMEELKTIDIDIPLIANVATNHVKPEKAAEYAAILQHHGASIVTFSDYEPENLVDAVRMAREKVDVPIMVKLPPFCKDIGKLCRELEDAGVNCIAAMDAVGPAMDIDIETGRPVLGNRDGYGYLSSSPIFPLTLAYISEICRNVTVPVIGVGGVTGYQDVIKLIMAGASGVGIVGGAILHGLGLFDRIHNDLIKWMIERSVSDLSEIRGLAQKQEDSEVYGWIPGVDMMTCTGCGLCATSCFKQAISIIDKKAVIDHEICVGCGVCLTTCPCKSITI
jgi:dihydroorotate dehydrogenase (NAD+) catalytic subunit